LKVGTIPKALHEHINTAFPTNVCLIATVLANGFAQVTARGSTMAFDDDHIALWERGQGSTTENMKDGSKVTVFFRKPELRANGMLPKGGIARLYGVAKIHKSGAIYDQVWEKLIQPEKDRDPQKKGWAVLVKIDRAEDLSGDPLKLD
jgi:Pyridoxamine 5'-phosphate oxidase